MLANVICLPSTKIDEVVVFAIPKPSKSANAIATTVLITTRRPVKFFTRNGSSTYLVVKSARTTVIIRAAIRSHRFSSRVNSAIGNTKTGQCQR